MTPIQHITSRRSKRGSSFLLGHRPGITRRVVRLRENELFSHTLMVGTTGSGKTTAALAILTQAIDDGWGVVLIDMKGEPDNTAALAGAAADAGVSYSQFSFTPGERCDHWTPLTAGDPAARMSRVICLSEWSEPYYRTACERFAQFAFVLMERNGIEPTFPALMELLDAPAKAHELMRALRAGERPAVERYLGRLLADRGQMSALAGLAARIGTLTDLGGPMYAPNSDAALDLNAISADGGVACFTLNSMRSAVTAAQIGALAALDVQSTVADRIATGETARPMLVMVDEFSALDGAQTLSLFARARSARVGMIVGTQELSDLARVNDQFTDQILGLTNNKLILRQEVPESAERLAMLAGTRQVKKTTRQRVEGIVATTSTGAVSERDVETFVVHPNEIRRLNRGQGVLIRKDPYRVERVDVKARHVEPDHPTTRVAAVPRPALTG